MASNNAVTNPTNLVAPSGDVTSFTGAQPANANNNGDPADQFVAKHFPTGWFGALTGESAGTQNGVTYPDQPALNQPVVPEFDGPGAPTNGKSDTNCDANHVANLDDPTYGLAHDLSLPANKVPAFNWITPNNCSDAHDASCQGNNLSGAFNANPGRPAAPRPRGDDPGQLHGWALRRRPLPALLHPDDRAIGGFRRRGHDRRHLRRGQPAVHHRQQFQQRARSG
jgi:hypothetical protein